MGIARTSSSQPDPEQTRYAIAAAVTACVPGGAHLIRVHDIPQMRPPPT